MAHENQLGHLRDRIKPHFMRIKPDNIIDVFHKYNVAILTSNDSEKVRKAMDLQSDSTASMILLDRLFQYPGWFPCLINVLKDADVKQYDRAETMLRIAAELGIFYEGLQYPALQIDDLSLSEQPQIQYNHLAERSKSFHDTTPKSVLQTNDATTSRHFYNQSVSLDGSENFMSRDGPKRRSDPGFEAMAEGHHQTPVPAMYNSDIESSGATAVSDDNINERMLNLSVDNLNQPDSLGLLQRPHASNPEASQTPSSSSGAHSHKMRKIEKHYKKVESHGPQYDFDFEETSQALRDFQGWHPSITEEEVFRKLSRHQQDNGHYLIWYWERKLRPCVSVMDKNEIKCLIAHKKPDPASPDTIKYYFFDKKDKRESTLRGLLDYHIQHGVKDMGAGQEGHTICFKNPILPP